MKYVEVIPGAGREYIVEKICKKVGFEPGVKE